MGTDAQPARPEIPPVLYGSLGGEAWQASTMIGNTKWVCDPFELEADAANAASHMAALTGGEVVKRKPGRK